MYADTIPIEGAAIHVLNSSIGTISDADGNFQLSVNPGKYRIGISALGYSSVNNEIDTDDNQALTISLPETYRLLDDVIVTAQKEEEDNQKVPFSSTAISSRQVEDYRLWNIQDIASIIPNLYSANPGDNRNVTSIRGITSSSYDPAVATYLDGVNQFSLDTYIPILFDVERIEVLRGPQGTLYGRNAMSGVINIITKRPTNKASGYTNLSFGSRGQLRYGLGVKTPIIKNKLFLGLSGLYDKTNGFYKNEFDGSDFDKKHSITGNYYLTYIANPQWAFTFNLKHHNHRNNGAFPLSLPAELAIENGFNVNQNAVAELVDDVFNGSLSAVYTGSTFNFTSLTTYQSNYRIYKTPIDGDFSPFDAVEIVNDYGREWNNVKVFTQEFRISSPSSLDSKLKWTGGVYAFHQKVPTKQGTHFGADAAIVGSPITNYTVLNTTTGTSKGLAVYGQATYKLSDRLGLTAGLRYDFEDKEQDALSESLQDPDPTPLFATVPDTSATTSFNAFSPKISFSYEINSNSIVYTLFSRGFRPGGLTAISPDPSQGILFAFKPEHSNNYELGLKNQFLNKRLQLNMAFFFIEVNDAQVPTLVLPQAVTVTRNAGKLTSKGFELEAAATLLTGLELNYSFGYTNASYSTLDVPQNGIEVSYKGNKQIFTPELTSMLALQYNYDLRAKSGLRLVLRGEWMHFGEQYFDLANQIKQKPYSLLNTRFGIASNDFEVMIWARNLGNEKYISYAYDFGASHLGNPRNWGISATKRF